MPATVVPTLHSDTMPKKSPAGILLGRTLTIGDIHGCDTALERLLDAVGPVLADKLIFLGDYVGKGPGSARVLDRLIALDQDHEIIPLLGNHDEMMLAALDDLAALDAWFPSSRKPTLRSYGDSLDNVPESHVAFLNSCAHYYETRTHIFVHANVDPDRPMNDQSVITLCWERLASDERPHRSGKTVICGHAAQKHGEPLNLGHAVCIDTYCWGGGWLTCLDVEKGYLWQTSQSGALRTAWLDEVPQIRV